MDPFSIAIGGIGLASGIAGGVSKVVTAADEKKRFLERQKKQALYELLRQRAQEMGATTYSADAKARLNGINEQADEQFQVDPTVFLPAVQGAAGLAGKIYDGVQEDSLREDEHQKTFANPESLLPSASDAGDPYGIRRGRRGWSG